MVYKTLTILGGGTRAEGELLYPYGSLIKIDISDIPSVCIGEKSLDIIRALMFLKFNGY